MGAAPMGEEACALQERAQRGGWAQTPKDPLPSVKGGQTWREGSETAGNNNHQTAGCVLKRQESRAPSRQLSRVHKHPNYRKEEKAPHRGAEAQPGALATGGWKVEETTVPSSVTMGGGGRCGCHQNLVFCKLPKSGH